MSTSTLHQQTSASLSGTAEDVAHCTHRRSDDDPGWCCRCHARDGQPEWGEPCPQPTVEAGFSCAYDFEVAAANDVAARFGV